MMPLGTVGGVDSAECASLLISALGGLSHVTASCLCSGLGVLDVDSLDGAVGVGSTSMLIVNGVPGLQWSACLVSSPEVLGDVVLHGS